MDLDCLLNSSGSKTGNGLLAPQENSAELDQALPELLPAGFSPTVTPTGSPPTSLAGSPFVSTKKRGGFLRRRSLWTTGGYSLPLTIETKRSPLPAPAPYPISPVEPTTAASPRLRAASLSSIPEYHPVYQSSGSHHSPTLHGYGVVEIGSNPAYEKRLEVQSLESDRRRESNRLDGSGLAYGGQRDARYLLRSRPAATSDTDAARIQKGRQQRLPKQHKFSDSYSSVSSCMSSAETVGSEAHSHLSFSTYPSQPNGDAEPPFSAAGPLPQVLPPIGRQDSSQPIRIATTDEINETTAHGVADSSLSSPHAGRHRQLPCLIVDFPKSRQHKRAVSAPDFTSMPDSLRHGRGSMERTDLAGHQIYGTVSMIPESDSSGTPSRASPESYQGQQYPPPPPQQRQQQQRQQQQVSGAEKIRCMFVENCDTGSQLRKAISHIFGRNKLCTRMIPQHVWVHFCRKHYQRSRYRNAHEYSKLQVDLVQKQIERVQAWSAENDRTGRSGVVTGWSLSIRKREQKRLEDRSSGRKRRYGTIDSDDDGNGEPDSAELNGTAVPVWLLEKCGVEYRTAEMQDIVARLRGDIEQGTLSQIPDIEILPNIKSEVVMEQLSSGPATSASRYSNAPHSASSAVTACVTASGGAVPPKRKESDRIFHSGAPSQHKRSHSALPGPSNSRAGWTDVREDRGYHYPGQQHHVDKRFRLYPLAPLGQHQQDQQQSAIPAQYRRLPAPPTVQHQQPVTRFPTDYAQRQLPRFSPVPPPRQVEYHAEHDRRILPAPIPIRRLPEMAFADPSFLAYPERRQRSQSDVQQPQVASPAPYYGHHPHAGPAQRENEPYSQQRRMDGGLDRGMERRPSPCPPLPSLARPDLSLGPYHHNHNYGQNQNQNQNQNHNHDHSQSQNHNRPYSPHESYYRTPDFRPMSSPADLVVLPPLQLRDRLSGPGGLGRETLPSLAGFCERR